AFRELEAFAQLGTELDAASQQQLNRGARLVELLKQGQYTPYDALDQAIAIYAAAKGFVDDLPLDQVHAFEEGLLEYMKTTAKETRNKLVEAQSFKGLDEEFSKAIKEFRASFSA
ncbi:MAG: F0F1 ATP synthase subunit alpha, partial [Phycisphaerales bacterium]|nr:F0F1 ATP synthase subunit alpha [Phycisphaerales bacterium]